MFNCRKSVPIRPTDIQDIGPESLLLGDNPGWLRKKVKVFVAPLPYPGQSLKRGLVSVAVSADNNPLLAGFKEKLEALPTDKRKSFLEGDWTVYDEISENPPEVYEQLMRGKFSDAPKDTAADKQVRILEEARKMESYR